MEVSGRVSGTIKGSTEVRVRIIILTRSIQALYSVGRKETTDYN